MALFNAFTKNLGKQGKTTEGLSTFSEAAEDKYQAGYPAFGPSEPDVVAQWLFDETSGLGSQTVGFANYGSANSFDDEVAGESLVPFHKGGSSGSITYRVAATGLFSEISPGFRLDYIAGSPSGSVRSITLPAGFDMTGTDFTIEQWTLLESTQTKTIAYLFAYGNFNDGGNSIINVYYDVNNEDFICRVRTDTGTDVFNTFAYAAVNVLDDTYHKYRWTVDQDGNMQLFQDSTLVGTASSSAINGKTITAGSVRINAGFNDANTAKGITLEHRYSHNLTNNSTPEFF